MDDFHIERLEDIESDLRLLRTYTQQYLTPQQLNLLTEAQNSLRYLRESVLEPVVQ